MEQTVDLDNVGEDWFIEKLDKQIIQLIGSSEDDGVEALIEKNIEDGDKVRRELN